MNKINFILTFLVLLLLSNTCQTKERATSEDRVVTISVDTDDQQVVPDVDEKSSYTEYGPGQVASESVVEEVERIQTAGIIIGPNSSYNTDVMDYVSCLLKSDVKINFVAGLGKSAVVAALFSQTKKPELVKWKFFRLKDKEDIDDMLEELSLSKKAIKRSTVALYLAKPKDKTISFDTKGDIDSNIRNNIKLNKLIMNGAYKVDVTKGSPLIANKVFFFSYDKKLSVSKNHINGKMVQINMPKQNYSLVKKCEIIKENL
ncbi:hypothetical protein [Halobacteriovorax sp. DPLXC-1]|uniref:hypothetical protein n=1 Tax=unclassified Halobacteriovorax TaxID=2639665 RepID=UPI002FF2F4F0